MPRKRTRLEKPSNAPHFRPLRYLPAVGVGILTATLIAMYALFLVASDPPRDLVLSRVLSLKLLCSNNTALSFVPNIGTLGLSSGFVAMEVVFFLRYIKNMGAKPGWAAFFLGVGTAATFSILWMLSFQAGRQTDPPNGSVIHQVTAGLSVFFYMIHAIATSAVYRRERFVLRVALSASMTVAAVAMMVVFFLEMFEVTSSGFFAAAQFVFIFFLFAYFLTLSDDTEFGVVSRKTGKVV